MDTHIWIWWLTGQGELSAPKRKRLERLAAEGRPPCLSVISLWESQMLFRKNRLVLTMDYSQWLIQAADPEVIQLLPLDVSVVLALMDLPEDFQGDPADRMIAATAKAHALPVMTEDRRIRGAEIVEVI